MSKWNITEYRVFPNVACAAQGTILTSSNSAKQLIEKVATNTGLKVITAYVLTEQPAKAWWVRIMNYSPDTSHKTR
ncbi:hypothetical protein [Methylobacter tundripaludum]|uniref:hypothetical protein n=1 Tax=Methylobacter tundripaludum TaxID=173365 RepID=UPI0012374F6D